MENAMKALNISGSPRGSPAVTGYIQTPNKENVGLLDLPVEVLEIIFDQLVHGQNIIDITTRINGTNPHVFEFDRGRPELLGNMQGVLLSCHDLRRKGQGFVFGRHHFISRNISRFTSFPIVLGSSNAALIQSLELNVQFGSNPRHESDWPRLIEFFTVRLASLRHLKLYSAYPNIDADAIGWDDSLRLRRCVQHRRGLFRFGAFVTLRHPKLNLMIYPAYARPHFYDDRPFYERDDRRDNDAMIENNNMGMAFPPEFVVCAVELEATDRGKDSAEPFKRVKLKRSEPEGEEEIVVKDLILNATKIRRYTMTELFSLPIDIITLEDNSTTLESSGESTRYSKVDHYGYLNRRQLDAMGVEYQRVDHMIEEARGL